MPRILTVCTANICRSAGAAALLTHALPPDVQVSSAGVAARDGHEMCPVTRQWLLDDLGTDAGAGHRSRALTDDLIHDADLVLVASTRHRKLVLARAPKAVVFTMREAASLVQRIPSLTSPQSPGAGAGFGEVVDALVAVRHRTRFAAAETETVTVTAEPGADKRRWFSRSQPTTVEVAISPYDVPDAHAYAMRGDHAPTFGTLEPALTSFVAALNPG